MLEAILSTLNQYQLIPFTNPVYAEIETLQSTPIQPEAEQPVLPQPSQPPVQPVPPIPMTTLDDVESEIARLQREEAEINKLSQTQKK